MHWNSTEGRKESQRAEKHCVDLWFFWGGWGGTLSSLCNHCKLHSCSYNVTKCKTRGKRAEAASVLWSEVGGLVLNHCDSVSHYFEATWVKESDMFVMVGGTQRTRGEHVNSGQRFKLRPCSLLIMTTAYPPIVDVGVLGSIPGVKEKFQPGPVSSFCHLLLFAKVETCLQCFLSGS